MFAFFANVFQSIGCVVVIISLIFVVYQLYLPKGSYVSDLGKKYILITGCDTGFGNGLAKQLDKLGCQVLATCLTEEGKTRLKEECSANVTPLSMDVTSDVSVDTAYERIKSLIPDKSVLWGVVNNAGNVNVTLTIETESLEDMQRIMDVNFWGGVRVTKRFLPLLKHSKGRIVNVISCLGRQTMPTGTSYCASKFALAAFTGCARTELRMFGISVHGIEPGFFKTPLTGKECLLGKFQKMWNGLEDSVKDEYGACPDAFANSLEIMSKVTSSNVALVTNAMEHALLSVWPKSRYVVGYDHLLFYSWFHLLPAFISDPLLSRLLIRYEPKSAKKIPLVC